MRTQSLEVLEAGAQWFEHPGYKPRARAGAVECWAPLAPGLPREDSLEKLARELDSRRPAPEHAERLRRAVEASARRWGLELPPAARRALETLGDSRALAVIAGQQPGFLGGPLFTLYKALDAVAVSRGLSARLNRPVVPVFWVAGEDHDVEEVAEIHWPSGAEGEAGARLPLPADRRPLSAISLEGEALTLLDAVEEAFRHRRYGALARELLAPYRRATLAGAFAQLFNRILGGHGLLLLDPEALRRDAAPIVRRVLQAPEEAVRRIEEGRRVLEELGIDPPVAARLPLFLLSDGRRHHLSPGAQGVRIDGTDTVFPRARILELLEESPERFSSGALLRPLVQEALLPCALTICGPNELLYHAQLDPFARWLEVPRPRAALRAGASLLEGRAARSWRRLGLDRERVSRARSPADLLPPAPPHPAVEIARGLEEEARRKLELLAGELPPGRRRPLERAMRNARDSLAALRARAEKAAEEYAAEKNRDARVVWHHLFPRGELQERRWCAFYYLAKYGTGWLEELVEVFARKPLSGTHLFVIFEEEEPEHGT